jgi:hypothetical protein
MAGRWAKTTVHIIPVFGESGGLLEHAVFDFFFNLPLCIKRGFKTRPVRWVLGTAVAFALVGALLYGGFARFLESRQPPLLDLEDAQVQSVTPQPLTESAGVSD